MFTYAAAVLTCAGADTVFDAAPELEATDVVIVAEDVLRSSAVELDGDDAGAGADVDLGWSSVLLVWSNANETEVVEPKFRASVGLKVGPV